MCPKVYTLPLNGCVGARKSWKDVSVPPFPLGSFMISTHPEGHSVHTLLSIGSTPSSTPSPLLSPSSQPGIWDVALENSLRTKFFFVLWEETPYNFRKISFYHRLTSPRVLRRGEDWGLYGQDRPRLKLCRVSLKLRDGKERLIEGPRRKGIHNYGYCGKAVSGTLFLDNGVTVKQFTNEDATLGRWNRQPKIKDSRTTGIQWDYQRY